MLEIVTQVALVTLGVALLIAVVDPVVSIGAFVLLTTPVAGHDRPRVVAGGGAALGWYCSRRAADRPGTARIRGAVRGLRIKRRVSVCSRLARITRH